MHLRVLLSIIGQLIAVPAALFLIPTTYPDAVKCVERDGEHYCDASTVDSMNSDSSSSSSSSSSTAAIMQPTDEEQPIQER